jgi:hypothetical protein
MILLFMQGGRIFSTNIILDFGTRLERTLFTWEIVKTRLTIYGPSSLDPERVFRVGIDQWNNHHLF